MTSHSRLEQTDQHRELDKILRALSAEPRRQLIDSLMDRLGNEPVTLPDAAIGTNMEPTNTKEFEMRLYHNHLPRLAEAGIISWDEKENQRTATRGDQFDKAATILEELQAGFDI